MNTGKAKTPVAAEETQVGPKTCLFAVQGNSRQTRRERIEAIAELEPSIAFLAAVFNFEWMIRRAILALSAHPTPDIRTYLKKEHGWETYKKAWKQFVKLENGPATLIDAIVADSSQRIAIASAISDALKARHPLVHGANGFIPDEIAKYNMELLLAASDALEKTLETYGGKWNTAFMIIRRITRKSATKDAVAQRKQSRKSRVEHEKRMKANERNKVGLNLQEAPVRNAMANGKPKLRAGSQG